MIKFHVRPAGWVVLPARIKLWFMSYDPFGVDTYFKTNVRTTVIIMCTHGTHGVGRRKVCSFEIDDPNGTNGTNG